MVISDARPENECLLDIEAYFRKEYSSMLSFASYLLNNKNLAEVAVQDTFVFALEHNDKLSASSSPEGWLYCVLKNIVRHMLRDQKSLLENTISVEEVPEPSAEDINSDLKIILGNCKNSDKQLLMRFYIEGYSIKELAKENNISVGACKMRLKRARNRIKDSFIT